jgi:hypothetical protein
MKGGKPITINPDAGNKTDLDRMQQACRTLAHVPQPIVLEVAIVLEVGGGFLRLIIYSIIHSFFL